MHKHYACSGRIGYFATLEEWLGWLGPHLNGYNSPEEGEPVQLGPLGIAAGLYYLGGLGSLDHPQRPFAVQVSLATTMFELIHTAGKWYDGPEGPGLNNINDFMMLGVTVDESTHTIYIHMC